ncbi:MAG: hypothetical protein WAS27_02140 [Candidatus Saccharimonadales bacterium]
MDDKTEQNIGDKKYSDTFKLGSLSAHEKTATSDPNKKPDDVKKQEQKGSINVKIKKGDKKTPKQPLKKRLKGHIRNKSSFAFIIVMLLGGLWYASILSPNILLVNIKDLYSNDLADATTALSKYTVKMIDHKLGKADCGEKESIKCKLSTMSRQQVLAFQKHGFTVTGEKLDEDNLDDQDTSNDKPESRWKVSSVTFPDNGGSASDGQSFAKIAESSEKMMYLANGVWNPKSSFFMDERFKQRIKTQFDLQKDGGIGGQSEKDVDEAFDAAMEGPDETMDKGGRGSFSLLGLAGDVGKKGIKDLADEIKEQPASYLAAQCGVWTVGKVAYNSTKKAKEVTLARYAMQYLKMADRVKSGQNADEVPVNVLSGKLAWSNGGGYNGKNATDIDIYRHIVLREGSISQIGQTFSADAFDAIGALLPASLQAMMTATATNGIANAPGMIVAPPADMATNPRDYCLEGQTAKSKSSLKPSQCPALTMAAGAAPSLAGLLPQLSIIAAVSDRICPPPLKGIWKMYPTAHATALLVIPAMADVYIGPMQGWSKQIANNFTHSTKGVSASEALFTGTGIILGDMAMSRGMQPANTATLVPYLAEKRKFEEKNEKIARYKASLDPFDIYNKYSFAGSLVRLFGAASTSTTNNTFFDTLTAAMRTLPVAVSNTASKAGAIYNLQPDEFNPGRLQCKDAEYIAIGIQADVGCNVRYSMGQWEMDAQVKNVLDYMLKTHSDVYKDKIKDLQQRLSKTDTAEPQDPADVQRQLSEVQKASGQAFIDKKTGEAIENSEYDKYLRYCVNRQDPWGRTGVDVRSKELSDEEKIKRLEWKDEDGNQIGDEGKGSPYEQEVKHVYMAVYEGAKSDQEWYTGKKCLENSEMLRNFRAYTMACSVDGSFAGSIDCTEKDRYGGHTDDFYTSNDIFFYSWY